MSITEELREWAAKYAELGAKYAAKDLIAIADRIDTEHEEALCAEYTRGKSDGFDDWYAQREDAMAEHGWVKLPVDANGEVIHLGDVVMLPDWPLYHHEVINLVYAHDGWAIISRHGSIEASEHTVHVKLKKPTVEDVLCELLDAVEDDRAGQDHIIAEYAKRLRLVGDAE